MTSKVLVKLPVVPFAQRKKPSDLIPLPNRNDESDEGRLRGYNFDKVSQLEQNMKFLQDQHADTLLSLHREVEVLRQRNRDLQFQLVFSKGSNHTSSRSSSPENSAIVETKAKAAAPCVNGTPLQFKLLEKELQDVKTNLDETKAHNTYLTEVIEKLKTMSELNEKSKGKQKMTDAGIQVDGVLECQQVELQARLDDAKVLVKKLLQKNMDQFEEIATMKSTAPYSNGNNNRNGNSKNRKFQHSQNQGPSNEVQGQEDSYHKFPLLQTQSYWHRASRGNHSYDHKAHSQGYRRNNKYHQDRRDVENNVDNTVLPQLQTSNVHVDKSLNYASNFKSGIHTGGQYYSDDRKNKKYRGPKVQRDHRDQDTREYHRESKYREQKTNQRYQREVSDSSKESRNYPNLEPVMK